mgnify:FL=1
MYNTVSKEMIFFLTCIAAGFFCAFLYDLLRISRRIVRVNDFVINFEDILFLGAAAAILFYASYLKNSGEIRWHGFIGGAAGVFLYIFIIGNRLLNVSCIIIKFIVKTAETLLKIILMPVRLSMRIFKKPIDVVMWYSGRGISRVRRAASMGKTRLGINIKNLLKMMR